MAETPLAEAPVDARRRLARVRDGRWFGGVCAGLGRYFDVNPAVYRLVFAALALAGGTGILLYLAAWLVIPDEGAEASVAEQALRDHRDRPGFVVAIGLLAFAAIVLLAHAALWPHPGNLWLAALVVGAGLIWWEVRAGRSRPVAGEAGATSPPAPRRPSLFLPVAGVLLTAGGVLGLLAALDAGLPDVRIPLAAAVVFVGAAVAVGAGTGRRVSGLVGLGILLLLVLVATLALHVPLRGGVGDRTYRPVSASAVHQRYRLAVGNLTLDLRDVRLPSGDTHLAVSVGLGDLRVFVPHGVAVDVTGKASAGRVRLFGREENGTGVELTQHRSGDARHLVLTTEVGAGDVVVRD